MLVYCTCPTVEGDDKTDVARQIAGKIVEQRLAACVNIMPSVESVYRWQGKKQYDREQLLIINNGS